MTLLKHLEDSLALKHLEDSLALKHTIQFFRLNARRNSACEREGSGFVYGTKTSFPSPNNPEVLPPTKRRSVQNAVFPERIPAPHGNSAEVA